MKRKELYKKIREWLNDKVNYEYDNGFYEFGSLMYYADRRRRMILTVVDEFKKAVK